MGEDDAKYINSAEGPLYKKSAVLYNFSRAKDAMRKSGRAILVEGYFDVLACSRVGVENVVAVSGTALTEKHAKLLKRSCETVTLCLDQDRAGKEAAERAFHMLSKEGIAVHALTLPAKDPDDLAAREPETLKKLLEGGGSAYMDLVLDEIASGDVSSAAQKRAALKRIVPLLQSLSTSTESAHYIGKAAGVLGTTDMTLKEDMRRMTNAPTGMTNVRHGGPMTPSATLGTDNDQSSETIEKSSQFSSVEIVLGMFILYPTLHHLIEELIEPEEGLSKVLYLALKDAPEGEPFRLDDIDMTAQDQERVSILQMYCEHHGFADWSESLAVREIKKNCLRANRDTLKEKQRRITHLLTEAEKEGKDTDAAKLQTQYQQVLKLSKMAG